MHENKKHPDVEEIFEELGFNPKKMAEDLKETAKAHAGGGMEDMVTILKEYNKSFTKKAEGFVEGFAKKYWTGGMNAIQEIGDPRTIDALCKTKMFCPKDVPAIIDEFCDYFKGLAAFVSLVLEVKKEDNIPKEAICEKIHFVKEKNELALKDIVHDEKYCKSCTVKDIQESFSSFTEILESVHCTDKIVEDLIDKGEECGAKGECYDEKCVGKALSILVITRIAFLGKMMWKTAKIPCKMAKAKEEAMEELAPKRVF